MSITTDSSYNFYLPELNFDVDASFATMYGDDTLLISDFSAQAHLNVDVNIMRKLFQFQTDSYDVTDASNTDIIYIVDSTTSTDISTNFIENTFLETNAIYPNAYFGVNTVPYDYVRYLAQTIFGHHNGVDLFNNEEHLRTSLNLEARFRLQEHIETLPFWQYADSERLNPSRTVMNQLIKRFPERFETLHPVNYPDVPEDELSDLSNNRIYYMPLQTGDNLFFIMTVSAADGQMSIVNSTDTIGDRTYLIRMQLTGDDEVWPVSTIDPDSYPTGSIVYEGLLGDPPPVVTKFSAEQSEIVLKE